MTRYEDVCELVNEYFADLGTRMKGIHEFCLAMILENALQQAEIELLRAELEEKFKIETE